MCREPGSTAVTSETDIVGAYECFVFDCDGVLWHGETPIEGARELVTRLLDEEKHVYFVTNASKRSRVEMHKKFQQLGFDPRLRLDQCYPSGFFCGAYLAREYGNTTAPRRLYVVGGAGLVAELEEQGFVVDHDLETPAVDMDDKIFKQIGENLPQYDGVVVGFDSNFNFLKLCKASLALQKNEAAFLCATNEDAFVRVGELAMPGNGAIAAIVRYCDFLSKGREFVSRGRYFVTGKPDPRIIDFVMAQAGVTDKARCLMVGDRLDTDIQLAMNAEIHSCFVLSGCSTEDDIHAEKMNKYTPTYVRASVKDLLKP